MAEQRFDIDPAHTRVGFSVKHMMVATVRGHFGRFEGFVTAVDGKPSRVEMEIEADSIETGVPDRDAHLRSADFFNAPEYPKLRFTSRSVEQLEGDRYRVTGDLTIRGVTKPVTVEGVLEGRLNDPWGNERLAGGFSGKINRKEWDLTWNQVLEKGTLLVGEDVRFELDVSVIRKLEASTAA